VGLVAVAGFAAGGIGPEGLLESLGAFELFVSLILFLENIKI